MNVHRERGCRLLEVKKYDLAAKEFRGAIANEPNDSTVHALLACCLLNLDEDEEAEREAEAAVGCDADDPYALYTLSRAKAACDKYREAFTAIEACLRLAPLDADYLFLRAALLHDVGRFDDALQAANEALRQDPNHVQAANLRILALQAGERFDEADLEIDRVLKVDPDFAWSHENKGRIELRNGRIAEALNHYREALRLSPNKDGARRGLIEALKSRNFFYRAMMWLFPRTGENLPLIWLTRALLVSVALGSLFGLIYGRLSPRWSYAHSPATSMIAGIGVFLFLYLFSLMCVQRFGEAFFVFLLRFDREGRTALTSDERRRADVIVGCLVTAIVLSIGSGVVDSAWFILAALGMVVIVMPTAIVLLLPQQRAVGRTTLVTAATAVSILAVMIGTIVAFPRTPAAGIFAGLIWVSLLRFFKRRRDSRQTIG